MVEGKNELWFRHSYILEDNVANLYGCMASSEVDITIQVLNFKSSFHNFLLASFSLGINAMT